MKYLIVILLLLVSTPLWAGEDIRNFVNHVYNQYWKFAFIKEHEGWIEKHPKYFTESFIRDYKFAVEQANKTDPELGLDYDVMMCGQDGPDHGYHTSKVDKINSNWKVELKANDPGWPDSLSLTLVREGKAIKIDDICDQRKNFRQM